ncbi:hypothetical protein HDU76_009033 [Blyttiomyces sp. JEL0837]|nr:hypothetical protein HDU76_009033 [Blyttiomyces sp. JEL0837]
MFCCQTAVSNGNNYNIQCPVTAAQIAATIDCQDSTCKGSFNIAAKNGTQIRLSSPGRPLIPVAMGGGCLDNFTVNQFGNVTEVTRSCNSGKAFVRLLSDCVVDAGGKSTCSNFNIYATTDNLDMRFDHLQENECNGQVTGGRDITLTCSNSGRLSASIKKTCTDAHCVHEISGTTQSNFQFRFSLPSTPTLTLNPFCDDSFSNSLNGTNLLSNSKVDRTCKDGSSASIVVQTSCKNQQCQSTFRGSTTSYNLNIENIYQPGCQSDINGPAGTFKTTCQTGVASGNIMKQCSGTGATNCDVYLSVSSDGLSLRVGSPLFTIVPLDSHCQDTVITDGTLSTIKRSCYGQLQATINLDTTCNPIETGSQCTSKISAKTSSYGLYLMNVFEDQADGTIASSGDSFKVDFATTVGRANGLFSRSCTNNVCDIKFDITSTNLQLRLSTARRLIIPTDYFNTCSDKFSNRGSENNMTTIIKRECSNADASTADINFQQECSYDGKFRCGQSLSVQSLRYKLRVLLTPGIGAILPVSAPCHDKYSTVGFVTTIQRTCSPSSSLTFTVDQQCSPGNCKAKINAQSTNYNLFVANPYDSNCQTQMTSHPEGSVSETLTCKDLTAQVDGTLQCDQAYNCNNEWTIDSNNMLIRFESPKQVVIPFDPTQNCQESVVTSTESGHYLTTITRQCQGVATDGSSASITLEQKCLSHGQIQCIPSFYAETTDYKLRVNNLYENGCSSAAEAVQDKSYYRVECDDGVAELTFSENCRGTSCKSQMSGKATNIQIHLSPGIGTILPLERLCLDRYTSLGDETKIERSCDPDIQATVTITQHCSQTHCKSTIHSETVGYNLRTANPYDSNCHSNIKSNAQGWFAESLSCGGGHQTATISGIRQCQNYNCMVDWTIDSNYFLVRLESLHQIAIPVDFTRDCEDVIDTTASSGHYLTGFQRQCLEGGSVDSTAALTIDQRCSSQVQAQCFSTIQGQTLNYKLQVNNLYENGCSSTTQTLQDGTSNYQIQCAHGFAQLTVSESCQGISCKSQWSATTTDLQVYITPGLGAIVPLEALCHDKYTCSNLQTTIERGCDQYNSTVTMTLAQQCTLARCDTIINSNASNYEFFIANPYDSKCNGTITINSQSAFSESLDCRGGIAIINGSRHCQDGSCSLGWVVQSTSLVVRLESPKRVTIPLDFVNNCQDEIVTNAPSMQSYQTSFQRTCQNNATANFNIAFSCIDDRCDGQVATQTQGYPIIIGNIHAVGCTTTVNSTINAGTETSHSDFVCGPGAGTVKQSESCTDSDCQGTWEFSTARLQTPIIPSLSPYPQLIVPVFDTSCTDVVNLKVFGDLGKFRSTTNMTRSCPTTTEASYNFDTRCIGLDCQSAAKTNLQTAKNQAIGILNLYDGCANQIQNNGTMVDYKIQCSKTSTAEVTAEESCLDGNGAFDCSTQFYVKSSNLAVKLGLVDQNVPIPKVLITNTTSAATSLSSSPTHLSTSTIKSLNSTVNQTPTTSITSSSSLTTTSATGTGSATRPTTAPTTTTSKSPSLPTAPVINDPPISGL